MFVNTPQVYISKRETRKEKSNVNHDALREEFWLDFF